MKIDIFAGLPEVELTREQELTASAEALVLHSLRRAVPYAITVSRGGLREDEALSLCYEALMNATKTFDPKQLPFFNYSKPFLRGYVIKNWNRGEVVKNAFKARSEFDEWKPKKKTTLADERHVEEQDWEANIPVCEHKTIESLPTMPEFEAIDLRERWVIVEPLLRLLTEQERVIIRLRNEGGFTCDDIARLLVPEVTKQAIHIAYDRALRKIRNSLLNKKLLYKL